MLCSFSHFRSLVKLKGLKIVDNQPKKLEPFAQFSAQSLVTNFFQFARSEREK